MENQSGFFPRSERTIFKLSRRELHGTLASRFCHVIDPASQTFSIFRAESYFDYTTGQARLYLPGDSSLISRHHANWRIHALQSLFAANSEDLHYSSVVTLSREDGARIREQLIQAIQKAKEIIKDSPEEDLFGFHMDFYQA